MKNRIILVLGVILTLAFTTAFTVNADNAAHTEKLTVSCFKNDVALKGMRWNIYRVAEILPNNSYQLSGKFAEYKVNINNIDTSQMIAAAETLETYATVDDIKPLFTGVINKDGIVEYDKLTYGVYLLSGIPITIDNKYYLPTPSIIVIDDTLNGEDDIRYNYNIKAVPKVKVLAASDRYYNFDGTVKLYWEKDREEERPKQVETVLLKNGTEFKSVVLNSENNWSYTWKNLSTRYEWSVIERQVPSGYTVSYVKNEINIDPEDPGQHDIEFIIKNTGDYVPTETTTAAPAEKLPQTGQLWWPVPVMSAAGMIVFIAGWRVNSLKRKKHEK